MKIQDKRTPRIIFPGDTVLHAEPGTVLEVIGHTQNDSVGEIVIRTTSDIHPFVSVKEGKLWGDSLENYTFKLVKETELILK